MEIYSVSIRYANDVRRRDQSHLHVSSIKVAYSYISRCQRDNQCGSCWVQEKKGHGLLYRRYVYCNALPYLSFCLTPAYRSNIRYTISDTRLTAWKLGNSTTKFTCQLALYSKYRMIGHDIFKVPCQFLKRHQRPCRKSPQTAAHLWWSTGFIKIWLMESNYSYSKDSNVAVWVLMMIW